MGLVIDAHDLARLKDAVPLADLFRAHGVELDERGRGLCPFHDETTPSFHVRPGRDVYKCFGCGASGDVISALQELLGVGFRGAVDRLQQIAGRPIQDLPPPRPRPAPEPPRRAPLDEVARLWAASGPLAAHGGASAWARARGFDPEAIDALGLARVLPTRYRGWPRWAGCGDPWRHWPAAGYGIAFPVHDHEGRMAGLRARSWTGARIKALGGLGLSVRGLVLANACGVDLLRGAADPGTVLVVEGETDMVAAEIQQSGRARVAVLGIGSGWWTRELAARIPDGSRVVIATDADDAGERYARALAQTLAGRCSLRRLS